MSPFVHIMNIDEKIMEILRSKTNFTSVYIDESHMMKPEQWGKVVTLDPSEYRHTPTDEKLSSDEREAMLRCLNKKPRTVPWPVLKRLRDRGLIDANDSITALGRKFFR